MTSPSGKFSIPKSESWRMFDAISPRYDILNRLLSFGLDILWRERLVPFLPDNPRKVLDLATGTADVLLALVRGNQNIKEAVGIDLADRMLAIGRGKIARANFSGKITLTHGDANQIPFEDNAFDAVTIAFGIRNVEDHNRVLREMRRVIKPGGRALILEFSLPENKLLRAAHLFYLRVVVPAVGGLVSGHGQAYRYLNRTIETFPCGDDFCVLMEFCGFQDVKAHSLMGGIATIYVGEKT